MSTYAIVIIKQNGKYMMKLGTFAVMPIDGRYGFNRQYEEGTKLAEREKKLCDNVIGFVIYRGHLRDMPDFDNLKENEFYKIWEDE